MLISLKISDDFEFDLLMHTKEIVMLIVGESLGSSESKMEMRNNISGSFREQIRSSFGLDYEKST